MENAKENSKGDIWNLIERFSGDKVILMIALFLMLISVISVFSSTPMLALETGTDRISIMTTQLKVVVGGVILMALLYFFGKSGLYQKASRFGFIACFLILFILVCNLNLGIVKAGEINGARRILKVFGKQVHVYEFVKVMIIMYLAWALDAYKNNKLKLTGRIATAFPKLALIMSSSVSIDDPLRY